ncbi:MAG: EscF/YscF/HrpA family type III secretion system needle major subunit [Puniceicoccales bacterium]|jgi:hypothetical protein|nr:EscF/YscF/HrpA family type III secretion system needle major subunit [Puniceicoccales bacterium]
MALHTNTTSVERLCTTLSGIVKQNEQNLNEAIETIESNGGDLSQAELLALQSKINTWSNLSNIASGILRAVGDALKATAQNIR